MLTSGIEFEVDSRTIMLAQHIVQRGHPLSTEPWLVGTHSKIPSRNSRRVEVCTPGSNSGQSLIQLETSDSCGRWQRAMANALQAEELGRRSENKDTRNAKVQDIATSCCKRMSVRCWSPKLPSLDRLACWIATLARSRAAEKRTD